MKPGNRVEEKTLTTEAQRRESLEAASRGGTDGEGTMVELGTRRATERARSGNSPSTVHRPSGLLIGTATRSL
jgi:hypothetical protein